jgi:protein TonB
MKTPVAPNGTSGKLSDAPALSAADFSSAVTPGGTSVLPSVMRSEPAAPAGSLAPPTSKSIREPQLISSVHAVYPAFAKQSNVQGKVVMNLTVDAKGDVVNAIVISGPPFLRQSATDAVKQWKYSPALIDGRPASAQISVSLDFRLN